MKTSFGLLLGSEKSTSESAVASSNTMKARTWNVCMHTSSVTEIINPADPRPKNSARRNHVGSSPDRRKQTIPSWPVVDANISRLLLVSSPRMDDRPLRERTIRQIQTAIAQMFGLSTEELRTKNKSHNVAFPRQIAMYLSKQMTDASLSEIGQEFGGKHHTTVTHSIAKIHQLRETDAGLNSTIETLLCRLRSTG
jgi:Bacterial dnaA protein helix-turn-helix